jgi:hypothetical protein
MTRETIAAGRHGGRASEHAGLRDIAYDEAKSSWITCRYGTFQGLEIGKVYVFDNSRKGKVVEKRENAGQKGGLPMIKVEWR